jgi:type VI secretion system protein ImpM
LGERWQDAFLTAPVWRFWLGAEICGTTVAGAIMSSLDGMGRYYPLTLHAVADEGGPISPPDIDAQDEWFRLAEGFLLSTLAKDVVFDDIAAALEGLAVPRTRSGADRRIVTLGDGLACMATTEAEFATAMAALRDDRPEIYASASFWWTAGGGDFPALALACRGLPSPYSYSTLLTGELEQAVHAR